MDLNISSTSAIPKKRRKILDNKLEIVSSLLIQWGFPELVSLFKDEEIDFDALLIMQPEFRKIVTSKLSIGRQIKFTKFLEDWQFQQSNKGINMNTQTDNIISTPVIECKVESPRRNSLTKNDCSDLMTILNNSYDGKTLLKFLNKNKELTNSARSTLLNLISTYYNSKNGNGQLSELLADQVKILFPKENRDLYVLKKKNRAKPIIKVHNKLPANGKEKLTKADILQKIHKKRSPRKSKSPSKLPFGAEEGAKQHNLYLLSNTCPWAEVEERWVRCQRFRANFLNEHSTEQILKLWPSYTQPLGYRLIDMDYEFKYPHSESLIQKWPSFEVAIIPILRNHFKKSNLTKQIDELDEIENKDGRAATLFLLLHHILIPIMKYTTKDNSGRKISKKYTIEDSQESFLKIASNDDEVQQKLNELRLRATPIQPFIFFVGENISEPIEIMVYFDEIKYKCTTMLQAVDICFKIFHVFNLEYPPAAFTFWTFIQIFFYNVYTEYDVDCLSASSLKEELEKGSILFENTKIEKNEL